MLKKEIYINGFSSIHPVKECESGLHVFKCVEPDYKTYIDTSAVRRLGKIQKIALVAAKMCLQNASVEIPDAIITGTGLGCLGDTEKFLGNMLEDESGLHSPTSFIQSTHNTISGQIAIMLKCYGYNNTHSHRGLSFERALEDACLLAKDNTVNVLVGAVDEMPDNTLKITQKSKIFYSEFNKNVPIAGEGVHYFLLSSTKKGKEAVILKEFSTIEGEMKYEDILHECHRIMVKSGIVAKEVDAVILGTNPGLNEPHYQELKDELFSHCSILQFKNLVGECFTASAFGMLLACKLLQGEDLDTKFYLKNTHCKVNTVLVYNQFKGISHSFFLLQYV